MLTRKDSRWCGLNTQNQSHPHIHFDRGPQPLPGKNLLLVFSTSVISKSVSMTGKGTLPTI